MISIQAHMLDVLEAQAKAPCGPTGVNMQGGRQAGPCFAFRLALGEQAPLKPERIWDTGCNDLPHLDACITFT